MLLVEYQKLEEIDLFEMNRNIGVHGLRIIREIADNKTSDDPVRLLTHCNAGWLTTVDWGTATSPMFQAFDNDVPIHDILGSILASCI